MATIPAPMPQLDCGSLSVMRFTSPVIPLSCLTDGRHSQNRPSLLVTWGLFPLAFLVLGFPLVFLPDSGAGGCLLGVIFFSFQRNIQLLKSGAVFFSISFSIDHGYMDPVGWRPFDYFSGFHCDIFSSGSQLLKL